jgi:hypothetical protein
MGDAKHTPGPWRFSTDGGLYGSDHGITHEFLDGPGKTCAQVGHCPSECGPPVLVLAESVEIAQEFSENDTFVIPSEADRALIESAPDLLSLLQDAVTSFGPHIEGDDEWLRFAREAIAKATGQKPPCPRCGNEDLEREEGTSHCLECGHTWSAS